MTISEAFYLLNELYASDFPELGAIEFVARNMSGEPTPVTMTWHYATILAWASGDLDAAQTVDDALKAMRRGLELLGLGLLAVDGLPVDEEWVYRQAYELLVQHGVMPDFQRE